MTHGYVKHCFIALTIEISIQGTVVGLVTYNHMIVYVCKCWYVMLVWLVFVWPRCWDKATHDSKIPAGHCYCSVQTPSEVVLSLRLYLYRTTPFVSLRMQEYKGNMCSPLGSKFIFWVKHNGFPIVFCINTCLDSDVVSFGILVFVRDWFYEY